VCAAVFRTGGPTRVIPPEPISLFTSSGQGENAEGNRDSILTPSKRARSATVVIRRACASTQASDGRYAPPVRPLTVVCERPPALMPINYQVQGPVRDAFEIHIRHRDCEQFAICGSWMQSSPLGKFNRVLRIEPRARAAGRAEYQQRYPLFFGQRTKDRSLGCNFQTTFSTFAAATEQTLSDADHGPRLDPIDQRSGRCVILNGSQRSDLEGQATLITYAGENLFNSSGAPH
jgi:hypothetical protein